ncbi:hypothetical protein ACFX11_020900 [Malus domestica]
MPLWDRDRETEGEGDSERERGRGRSGDPRFCTVKERPRVSHRGLGFDVFLNLLINSDGEFNADGLDRFVKEVKLTECGLSYAVVAVMGPQSSGKRTLLNHLFGLSLGRWMLTVEGAKLQRVFGLPSVLAVSRAQLPWIWRGLMGGRGAR